MSKSNELADYFDQMAAKYDALAAGGTAGSEADQGFDDWIVSDPRERRNMQKFIQVLGSASAKQGRNVLVAGCSDGLAAQFIARSGYRPVGFDLSAEMVQASRNRLATEQLDGEFFQADITDTERVKSLGTFAGATLIHIAPCLPIVEDDVLMKAALAGIASAAPHGPLYVSNTYYAEPEYRRELSTGDTVTYYRREPKVIARMLDDLHLKVISFEHFEAADALPSDPGYGYDYINDYFIAVPKT